MHEVFGHVQSGSEPPTMQMLRVCLAPGDRHLSGLRCLSAALTGASFANEPSAFHL